MMTSGSGTEENWSDLGRSMVFTWPVFLVVMQPNIKALVIKTVKSLAEYNMMYC